MENWMNVCRSYTNESNQLAEGYYAEIASDEGVETCFLFGNSFIENETDIIRQAYDYIREHMPEYDASEINIRFAESAYRAYEKIFVNEGFDANIEREVSGREAKFEGFFARVYDSLHAQEQGDFVDEFTLAVGYDIEELSDEAFIKGAIEYLRPTLIHEKEQTNMKKENTSENTMDKLRLKEQMGKMAEMIEEEEMTGTEITQERAEELFKKVLDAVHFSVEHSNLAGGYVLYDEETHEYRGEEPVYAITAEDVENDTIAVCQNVAEVFKELDTFICDSFIDDMTSELEAYKIMKRPDIPQTIGGILEIVQEWEGLPETVIGNKFYKDHEEEIAMMDFIVNHIDKVDLDEMTFPNATDATIDEEYCIMNIDKKMFVKMLDEKAEGFALVNAENSTVFYDEADAKNITEMLNNETEDCYIMLNEDALKVAEKLHIRDGVKENAVEKSEKKASKKEKNSYERD